MVVARGTQKNKALTRKADSVLHIVRPVQESFDFLDSDRSTLWLWSPAFLAQTCLPYSEVTTDQLVDGAYVRHNGDLTMRVYSPLGASGIPYGKLPRQFMIWLVNTISYKPDYIVDGWLRIKLSFRKFCEQIGIDHSRGVRGSGRALVEQMRRLMTCDFTFTQTIPSKERKGEVRVRVRRFQITTAMDMTWQESDEKPRQWLDGPDSGFRLSADFMTSVMERRMMLNPTHIAEICRGKSPMRLDVYLFLAHRNYALLSSRHGLAQVQWNQLHGQFGSNSGIRDFMRMFRRECEWIQTRIWPGLRVNTAGPQFVLSRSHHPTPCP